MAGSQGDLVRVRVIVRGIVQGVGYRYFAKSWALRLGIKGYVKNQDDGSVLVVAEGSRDAIEKFLEELRRGPPAAIVDSVEVTYEEPKNEFTTFTIVYD